LTVTNHALSAALTTRSSPLPIGRHGGSQWLPGEWYFSMVGVGCDFCLTYHLSAVSIC